MGITRLPHSAAQTLLCLSPVAVIQLLLFPLHLAGVLTLPCVKYQPWADFGVSKGDLSVSTLTSSGLKRVVPALGSEGWPVIPKAKGFALTLGT